MNEQEESVRQKTIEVCECMKGWRLDEEQEVYGTLIVSNSGGGLVFSPIWNNSNRVEIHGYYGDLNQYLPYKREKTEITVSMAKTSERIAKDIEKRLLPVYEKVYAETMEAKKVDDKYKREKAAILKTIQEVIGGDAHIIHDKEVISYKPFECDVEYWSGHNVRVKIILSLEKAVEILKILGKKSDVRRFRRGK